MQKHTFRYNQPFHLEGGGVLDQLEITYHTAGTYNPDRQNVVWVCHALTANSNPFDWWPGLFGEVDLFNSDDYFIVCANILGSCYGSTNPLSLQRDGSPYYYDFPLITIRDMIAAHELLRQHLGIERIHLVTGASMGGQQAVEWAIRHPERFDKMALLATNARHSPWGIAFNESQRLAIRQDPSWGEKHPLAGIDGMKTARSIALLSYRHYGAYLRTQGEADSEKLDDFRASSYQRYQGEKLARRFNAFSYWTLSKAMDSHDVGRGRRGVAEALSRIKADTLVLGISTDTLFPLQEQRLLARYIPGARYQEMYSAYGHDGFLIETEKLSRIFQDFLKGEMGRFTRYLDWEWSLSQAGRAPIF